MRVVAENSDRFARVVMANTGLPDGQGIPDEMAPKLHELMVSAPALSAIVMGLKLAGPIEGRAPFIYWVRHCDAYEDFSPGAVIEMSLHNCLAQDAAGYRAPFPSEEYMQGARQFSTLLPIILDNPAIPANRAAWQFLRHSKNHA